MAEKKKEEPKEIDIKKMSVDELKVMVYDTSMQLGKLQEQINILNAEINSRG